MCKLIKPEWNISVGILRIGNIYRNFVRHSEDLRVYFPDPSLVSHILQLGIRIANYYKKKKKIGKLNYYIYKN